MSEDKETFEDWHRRIAASLDKETLPIFFRYRERVAELEKYISGSNAIQGESLECKITGLKAGSMSALNSKRLVLLEKTVKENKALIKTLREAVSKIEFYGEQDNWCINSDMSGGVHQSINIMLVDGYATCATSETQGKRANEYLNSETYLNIKHLLEEDKK